MQKRDAGDGGKCFESFSSGQHRVSPIGIACVDSLAFGIVSRWRNRSYESRETVRTVIWIAGADRRSWGSTVASL
jgi:hypothetical protein